MHIFSKLQTVSTPFWRKILIGLTFPRLYRTYHTRVLKKLNPKTNLTSSGKKLVEYQSPCAAASEARRGFGLVTRAARLWEAEFSASPSFHALPAKCQPGLGFRFHPHVAFAVNAN